MNTFAANSTHHADQASIETVKTVSKSSLKTLNTVTDWRRANAATDPSLIFGSLVFAQVVAGDLSRQASENVIAVVDGVEEAGDESLADSIAVQDANGLFGAVAPVSGLVPVAGGVAALAGLPSSGSDLSRASRPSASASEAPVEAEAPESTNNSSFIARSFESVRGGEPPTADGAAEAQPEQEAAGAQATATEAQQFAGGGADPFSAGIPQPPAAEVPEASTPVPVDQAPGMVAEARPDQVPSAQSDVPSASAPDAPSDELLGSGNGVQPVSTAADPGFSDGQSALMAA